MAAVAEGGVGVTAAVATEETGGAAASAIAENVGGHTVYQEVVGGVTKYVGQTACTLAARAGEHPRETGRVIQPVVTGLSRQAARTTEQALIDLHGLAKEGGNLANKINSVASSSPAYQSAKQLGTSILQELGIIE